MSRPLGSKGKIKQPKIVESNESERLEYLAALLLEIVEEELQKGGVLQCNQS